MFMRFIQLLVMFALGFFIIGCSTQLKTSIEHNVHLLQKDEIKNHGMSFITPTTITGMEEDKQYLALTFSHALHKIRTELKITDLSKVLGMINQTDATDDYSKMYDGYRETGIFNKKVLEKIGKLTGNRYACQLKLSHFKSDAQGRWSMLGFSIFDTEYANLRLFVQIWDTKKGIIVWEAAQEVTYAYDTTSQEPVTFEKMIHLAAKDIAKVLP